MALKVQPSFSAGELDPSLHERTTLEKYKAGLKTGRNVSVGKSGRLVSRGGRRNLLQAKITGRRVLIHPMAYNGSFLEWGHEYVRVYTVAGTFVGEYAHALTEDSLDSIHFLDIDFFRVMVFVNGVAMLVLGTYSGGGFLTDFFDLPVAPTFVSNTVTGTGYDVDYQITFVVDGMESLPLSTATGKLPITAGTGNIIIADVLAATLPTNTPNFGLLAASRVTEMKVYRRPRSAGAYGYVGSSSSLAASGGGGFDRRGTFTDVGAEADYSHAPPTLADTPRFNALSAPTSILAATGTMYQQRLVLMYKDQLVASRPGFPGNFYRDYPVNDGSALSLKIGTSGYPQVLRMIENDGLIAFTTRGIFVHLGAFTKDNLAMNKQGNWIIDHRVPPIAIPGGVLFIDSLTNTVRELRWSLENGSYVGDELSVFSDHLFNGKRIRSWAFDEGQLPTLMVVFTDGTSASLTYEPGHQMKAWTRHDSVIDDVEYVVSMGPGLDQVTGENTLSNTIYVVNRNDVRFIEIGVPRYLTADRIEDDLEAYLGPEIAAMDAMTSWKELVNDSLVDDDITITPLTAGVFDGPLTVACVNDGVFVDPGAGEVGRTLRWFNPDDRTRIDLEITARASNNSITVTPSEAFPQEYLTNPRLYLTKNIFDGLTHLEGEQVAIVCDGDILASPYNDIENLEQVTVDTSEISLPDDVLGAIVHVGLPYIKDVETLDIDTVEQRPTLIESKTVNKVYVKVQEARGLYVSNRFAASDALQGSDITGTNMVTANALDSYEANYEEEDPVIGNRYEQPVSSRMEISLAGDWSSQGRICLRSVDPVHFEILSIIPDLDDQRR